MGIPPQCQSLKEQLEREWSRYQERYEDYLALLYEYTALIERAFSRVKLRGGGKVEFDGGLKGELRGDVEVDGAIVTDLARAAVVKAMANRARQEAEAARERAAQIAAQLQQCIQDNPPADCELDEEPFPDNEPDQSELPSA